MTNRYSFSGEKYFETEFDKKEKQFLLRVQNLTRVGNNSCETNGYKFTKQFYYDRDSDTIVVLCYQYHYDRPRGFGDTDLDDVNIVTYQKGEDLPKFFIETDHEGDYVQEALNICKEFDDARNKSN